MKVGYVLGTTAGGTGAHVAMLARECAARGMPVGVFGPEETGRRFFPAQPGRAGPAFAVVDISDRPRPAHDLATVLRLRRLLRAWAPDVVHAHGLRAGALTALALAGRSARRRRRPPRRGNSMIVKTSQAYSRKSLQDQGKGGRGEDAGGAAAGLGSGREDKADVGAGLPSGREDKADGGAGLRSGRGDKADGGAGPRWRGCALLVTVHNGPAAGGAAGLIYRVLERIVARRADAVSWVSGDLGARMRRAGARDAGRALVPAPEFVPPSAGQITAVRASLGGQDRPIVFAAGRLVAQKGYPVLLAAAARWQDRDPVPLLVIAGEGPLAADLADQARSTGIAVRFLGQRADIPALLGAADVVVVPSVWEGQPLIVQEALRMGRPLVAARVGGIPEVTGEDAALLVPQGDPAALAAAVGSVLDDPSLAAKLGAAAAQRAGELPGTGEAVDAVIARYHRLLGAAG